MRGSWRAVVAVVAAGSAAGLTAGLAASSSAGTMTVVKAVERDSVKINRYLATGYRFAPGTITVKSGSMLTFEYASKQTDPHTLTIAPASQLPRTVPQIIACPVCRLALGHVKSPTAPPGPTNPIVAFYL